jgi:dCTP deaminase
MILSGLKIIEEVNRGSIVIDPFSFDRVGPNSYNIRLSDEILIYKNKKLDCKKSSTLETTQSKIDQDKGITIYPGTLYLGSTIERTYTDKYVPMIEGRSSIGRLGVFIHITAGFGDVGFNGRWTLEISSIQPCTIYPGMEIGQIYFHTIEGQYKPYDGKYNNNVGTQPSFISREFQCLN